MAVSTHAHVGALSAGGAVLGGLGLGALGLKGAALAGIGAGAKLSAIGLTGLAIGTRIRRGNLLNGGGLSVSDTIGHGESIGSLDGDSGISTIGGIDSIRTLDDNDGWLNGGIGDGGRGDDGRDDGGRGDGGQGNVGGWNDDDSRGNGIVNIGGWNNDGSRGNGIGNIGGWNNDGNRGNGNVNIGGWNDDSSNGLSHSGWYLVGPPKGAPHITLTQGKLSHGGIGDLNDSIRRNNHIEGHDKKG